jgi:uncharacterized protein YkwD
VQRVAVRETVRLRSMTRGHWIASIIGIAAVVLTGAGILGVGRPDSSGHESLDNTLLVQINAVREAHSLGPLKTSGALSVVAAQHTAEMGRDGYFGHASTDHTVFWKRIEQTYRSAGFRSWDVGENLLFVAPDVSASKAVGLWMHSPEHRANLLDPSWREIGIASRHYKTAPGIYENKAVTILTTDFGARHGHLDSPQS